MIKILGYDFEDNPVEGFFCDFRKRRINLFFDDIYDICLNKYISETPYHLAIGINTV